MSRWNTNAPAEMLGDPDSSPLLGVWSGYEAVFPDGNRLQMRTGIRGRARARLEGDGTVTLLNSTGGVQSRGHRPKGSDLGAGPPQRWNPRDMNFYERQWQTQRGAWGDPGDVADHLQMDVSNVIIAFKRQGETAGLAAARVRGLMEPARLYLAARADTEEELAARLARIRARLARAPSMTDRLAEAFLAARLDEVRAAGSHTPPQAVADRPEVPRRMVPRWIPYAALGVGVIALVRSFGR